MIPIRIRVKGFMGYRNEAELQFDGASLWVLSGSNGSGKSAIFDAITFVLFGLHRAGKSNFRDLINQQADRSEVELDFGVSDDVYRVKRTINQRGQTACQAWQLCGPSEPAKGRAGQFPIPETDRVTGLEQWIKERVGLSGEAFLLSVLLRQGEADALLRVNAAARHNVLSQIVDLTRYEQLCQRAVAKYSEFDHNAKSYGSQLQSLHPVSDESIRDTSDRISEAETRLQQAQEQLGTLAGLKSHAATWSALSIRHAQAQQRLAEVRKTIASEAQIERNVIRKQDLDQALPSLKKWLSLQHEMSRAVSTLTEFRGDVEQYKKDRDDLARALDQRRTEATKMEQERESLQQQYNGINRQLIDIKGDISNLDHLCSLSVSSAKLSSELSKYVTDLEALAATINKNVEDTTTLNRAFPWLRSFAVARTEWHQAGKNLSTANEQLQKVNAQLVQLRAESEAIEYKLSEADAEITAAEKNNAVAKSRVEQARIQLTLLDSLTGKATCDLCGQVLTPTHIEQETVLRASKLNDAETLAKKTQDELARVMEISRQTRLSRQDIQGEIANALADHQSLGLAADRAQQAGVNAEAKASDALKHLPPEMINRIMPDGLTNVQESFATSYPDTAELARLQNECNQLGQLQNRGKKIEEQIKERDQLRARHHVLTTQIGELEARYSASQQEEIVKTYEALQAREKATKVRLDTVNKQLQGIKNAVSSAEKDIEGYTAELRTAEGRMHKQQLLVANLNGEVTQAEIGLSSHAWLPKAVWDASTLHSLEQEVMSLQDAISRLQNLANARQESHRLETTVAEITLSMSQIPQDARRPVDDIVTQEHTARKANERAMNDRIVAEREKKEFEQAQTHYREIDSAYKTASRRAQLYKELAELLDRKHLQHHLLQQVEQSIVANANKTLDRVSRGKMRLGLQPGDSNSSLDLVAYNDDVGSKSIPVDFLSGGQRFRVAVSLALGIGQFASQCSRRVESVIIDEGFGSLDQQGRIEMAEELRQLQTILQRVIVVSHQEDFVAAFPNRYFIQMEGGTSTVTLVE
jgi:DNA repair exonuclease SbcCD ATPase subunit